jgi:Xaa-Pro aminopeptidase
VVLHGLGTDDEPPFLNFPDVKGALIPRGELQENQVICVEFYAGKVGEQDGVKLEDQVLVTKDGPVLITHYPYDRKLLGR